MNQNWGLLRANCCNNLYYSAVMKLHIETGQKAATAPQVLRIAHEGRQYAFQLRHATLEQRYPGRNWCRFREHAHDVYHIVLYTGGADELLLGDTRYAVERGRLALIQPGDWHDVAVHRKAGIVYSEVTFDFLNEGGAPLRLPFHALVSAVAGMTLDPIAVPVALSEPQVQRLHGHFERLLGWLQELHPLSAMETQRTVVDMLAFLARECYAPHRPAAGTGTRLDAVRSHIERHYRERLAVALLAEMAGVSRGHFLRSFKQTFGTTPIAYQQRLRIEAAKTLLRYTEYSCKTVAQHVGYEDEYLFSKTFKKVTGQPPTEYRHAHSARR